MSDIIVEKDERIDDLQFKGLKIVQNKKQYCFSSDAVLLCNFVKAKPSDTIVDLCSGSGVVGILAQAKTNAKRLILVEKQEKLAKMCKKTLQINKLQQKVELYNIDIKDAPYFLPHGRYLSGNAEIDMARFEIEMNFDLLCSVASRLLKYAGRFYFITDSSRTAEIMVTLTKYNLEPKVIEFVFPKNNKHSNVVLVECIKKGKPGAKVFYNYIGE